MPLYIGIDGGGTKTACALGDADTVLSTSRSAGSNVVRLGEERAGIALREAISQACWSAGVSPLSIEAVCVGASGAGRPEVQQKVQSLVRRVVPRSIVRVVGDHEVALEAALGQSEGVVVIAGTGSIAYGRNAFSETARAGGWGSAVSDEGSGQWIGREAIARALRIADTSFVNAVMRHWKLESHEKLIQYLNQSPPLDFSSLLPLVIAAQKNDPMLRGVLRDAGAQLAMLVETVLRRLWSRGSVVRVGLVGGVFANSPQVRLGFLATLRRGWPTLAVSFRIADPVMGALSIAKKM
jgi:N-acetylglucosamine kinase-like BadF-type ATPase